MKAQPLKLIDGVYHPCDITQATHLRLKIPGPFEDRILPLYPSDGPSWVWNNDYLRPTLRPSIRTNNGEGGLVCHCFVTDGKVSFLGDSTHEFANKTVDLLDIDN